MYKKHGTHKYANTQKLTYIPLYLYIIVRYIIEHCAMAFDNKNNKMLIC